MTPKQFQVFEQREAKRDAKRAEVLAEREKKKAVY